MVLCSSLGIIRIMKSRFRWALLLACMWEARNIHSIFVQNNLGSLLGRIRWEDKLKCISEK